MACGMSSKVGSKTGKLGKIGCWLRATRQGETQQEEENLTCRFHVRVPSSQTVRRTGWAVQEQCRSVPLLLQLSRLLAQTVSADQRAPHHRPVRLLALCQAALDLLRG